MKACTAFFLTDAYDGGHEDEEDSGGGEPERGHLGVSLSLSRGRRITTRS